MKSSLTFRLDSVQFPKNYHNLYILPTAHKSAVLK